MNIRWLVVLTVMPLMLGCQEEDNPAEPSNHAPVIESIIADPDPALPRETVTLNCVASDPDGDPLSFLWTAPGGTFHGGNIGDSVRWITPDSLGTYGLVVTVSDSQLSTQDHVIIEVTIKPPTYPNGGDEWTIRFGEDQIPCYMIYVEPGSFWMGKAENDPYNRDEELPRHQVNISEGIWVGKYEVTQALWSAVVTDPDFPGFRFPDNPNRPAEGIAWDEIKECFLEEINIHEEGSPWRLPTEAEWEYFARAGTDYIYYWGDESDVLGDHAWGENNSDGETHDVGQKLPNPWGFYDIHGNVWEWCEDDWHDNYIDAPTDGSAWISEPRSIYRVIKGGGIYLISVHTQTDARRDHAPPNIAVYYAGFRLVRSAE